MKVIKVKRKVTVVREPLTEKVRLYWEESLQTLCPFEDGDVLEVTFKKVEKNENTKVEDDGDNKER